MAIIKECGIPTRQQGQKIVFHKSYEILYRLSVIASSQYPVTFTITFPFNLPNPLIFPIIRFRNLPLTQIIVIKLMGQLHSPPILKLLPALPWAFEFQHPSIQRMKQTPFLRSTVYSYQPSIFYEKPDIPLGNLVTPRMGTKGLFPQNQILKLMKVLIDGLAFLESRQIRYGDIHSQNIYYDKHSKSFKLAHPHNIQQTGYELALCGKRFSFLSPEYLLALSQGKTNCELKMIQKSDVFALGILMIEVCTLKNSSELYDPENYDILHGVIQERLGLIRDQYYSDRIAKPIGRMIEYDMDRRMAAVELKALFQAEERQAGQQPQQVGIPVGQPQSQPQPQTNSRLKMVPTSNKSVPPPPTTDATRRVL